MTGVEAPSLQHHSDHPETQRSSLEPPQQEAWVVESWWLAGGKQDGHCTTAAAGGAGFEAAAPGPPFLPSLAAVPPTIHQPPNLPSAQLRCPNTALDS